MTTDDNLKRIALLERRLLREKTARESAESILEQKSREIYEVNQNLTNAVGKLQKLTVAVEQSPIIVLISDVTGRVDYVNSAFEMISGYASSEVVGKDIRSLGLFLDEEPLQGIKHVFSHKTFWKGEIKGVDKTKNEYGLSINISPILDNDDCITHFLYNCEDITKQKADEAKIYDLAHYDTLTTLYNRFSIDGILSQAVSSSERNNSSVAVLFIDMDRFKQVNDTHGHKFGDVLLQQVATRLKAICRRKNDYIARIGGDEFLIVLTDTADTNYIALTAGAITEALSLPYLVGGETLYSSPSTGIAIYPDDGLTASDLIKSADAAMYHAKKDPEHGYSFFTKELNRQIEEKNYLEAELRNALEHLGFELHYQPQVYLKSPDTFGVEALIRWPHPKLGMVPPDQFIRLAEERGLIYGIGSWVIDTAFQQLKDWSSKTDFNIKMAVNLSAHQISDKRFMNDLKAAIKRHDIAPAMVELEVTESVAMEDPEQSIATLNQLREMGFELAIDDFGTGYSSLSYLKVLPIQTLKLDKSFLDNMESDLNNVKICKAAISLSHDLGMSFVAEGVETLEQVKFLMAHDCDILQGYYFCRPSQPEQALNFMQNFELSEILN